MPVTALYPEYKYPSRSRQELYGDDILVHVGLRGNRLFAAPSTHRVPPAMTFAAFLTDIVTPWVSSDPELDPQGLRGWTLDGSAITPEDTATLADLGVGHKSLLTFEA
ncbi:phenol hydroxylase subunit P4 [Knoellia koreensis]|uniref:Phenol hydroxylase n=1 Tax=Knoellia koreensis TaxID=2730921 RepID=A0A849H765_9MICO|nr:phenol hydroxylase subunit P4 [Knoellia sp. DB2414S]NNM45606.1 phenol hydroxylase [Knoellia sp. DB2414S]